MKGRLLRRGHIGKEGSLEMKYLIYEDMKGTHFIFSIVYDRKFDTIQQDIEFHAYFP